MSETLTAQLTISNQRGLHARASAKFVNLVDGFDAKIQVSREGETVDGGSIIGLMMLGASLGMTIEVAASGTEAADALQAISDLVARKFDEE